MVNEATSECELEADPQHDLESARADSLQREISQMQATLATMKEQLAVLIERLPAQASYEDPKQNFIYECLKRVAPGIRCASLPQDLSTNACKRAVRIGRDTTFYAVLLIDPTIRMDALTQQQRDAIVAAVHMLKLKPEGVRNLDNYLAPHHLSHKDIERLIVPK